ncbi:putative endonuclease III-like protein [Fervidobacterium pennivorans DSM 9078]|uniref:Endonuclease III-like protein n=2 Tax=Fervidobacterium pennivorans TaxID=93466 RepID=H9UEW2_FERPD|nr:putative endonuclease III-like protein [Fervidobacterium pennivorans DSM 9078]
MCMLIFSNKATSLPYGLQKKLEIAHALGTTIKLVLLDELAESEKGIPRRVTEENYKGNISSEKRRFTLRFLFFATEEMCYNCCLEDNMCNHPDITRRVCGMKLENLYEILREIHGPQGKWWPGTPEEIIVSAVLTQNTNWKNVEKALENIKEYCKKDILHCLAKMSTEEISFLIKPAGFFNVKAQRLKNLLTWLKSYNFDLEKIKTKSIEEIRDELLSVKGIGKETADSIILYALELPVFVVDAYTKRLLDRLLGIKLKEYDEYRLLFEKTYPRDVALYQEFHGLIVEHAKALCRTNPLCATCPVESCKYKNTKK